MNAILVLFTIAFGGYLFGPVGGVALAGCALFACVYPRCAIALLAACIALGAFGAKR